MFKFGTIGQIEHGEYPFEDAVVDSDVKNGAFGDVTDGKFTANASGKKVIMQLENGDNEAMPEYIIPKGSHVRVLDPSKVKGELEVYGYPLPETFKTGDTLGCFTITEVIGNKIGAVVKTAASTSTTTPTTKN